MTAPQNHSEAEDVYDFALKVEQGSFADQAGVNRVLALPMFGRAYRVAQTLGYSGRAFPLMIFINRILAVGCLVLFWKLLSCRRHPADFSSYRGRPVCSSYDFAPANDIGADIPPTRPLSSDLRLPTSVRRSLPVVLCLAFSYGFWRYANEAETYILASVLVLGAWCLALRGKVWWSVGVSALGIMVHLLNLIPLLLVIPLYYLLSKDWKKALLHGVLTGLLVVVGYAVCAPWLDFSELGAQHHALEGGIGLKNLIRGGIALGQCLVSGNFLFGFESFRELLTNLFPSRMLGEEFYMAAKMPIWIPWAGIVTVVAVLGLGVWGGVRSGKGVWGWWRSKRTSAQYQMPNALILSALVWLFLYAVAVIRTEAGSPELWIMALIPFWLLVAPLVRGRWGRFLVAALFAHNLVAGLLAVLSERTDYHVAKGKWLVEHSCAEDFILMDYEPVMVFYLDYFTEARVLNSGQQSLNEIKESLGSRRGNAYAVCSFFQPLESMLVRSPAVYEQMSRTGEILFPMFGKVANDEFGGVWKLAEPITVTE